MAVEWCLVPVDTLRASQLILWTVRLFALLTSARLKNGGTIMSAYRDTPLVAKTRIRYHDAATALGWSRDAAIRNLRWRMQRAERNARFSTTLRLAAEALERNLSV